MVARKFFILFLIWPLTLFGARSLQDLDHYYATIDQLLVRVQSELQVLSQELDLISSSSCFCDCAVPDPDDIILSELYQTISNQQVALNSLTQTVSLNNSAFLSCCSATSNAVLNLQALIQNTSNAVTAPRSCCWLANAPLYNDVVMTKNCDLCPLEKIVIARDLTINGQGGRISFCCPNCPQFELNPGITLTLKNVALARISSNTLFFGNGSKIVFDKGVRLELADDLVLTHEHFVVKGDYLNPNILTVKAFGCPKNVTILPLYTNNNNVYQTIELGTNSLVLENIYLIGIESISIAQEIIGSTIYTGSIVLSGFASLLVQQSTRAVFEIEGLNNHIRLAQDNLTLSGYLLFSDYFDSEVGIQFRLYDPIPTWPTLFLADNFLYLSSTQGRASLTFDDFWIRVVHLGVNSFVTNNNAFLAGKTVEVLNYPIRQLSNDLTLDAGLSLRTELENALDFTFLRAPHTHSTGRRHITTAFDQRRRQLFSQAQVVAQQQQKDYSIVTARSALNFASTKKRALYKQVPAPRVKKSRAEKIKRFRFSLAHRKKTLRHKISS